jgi:hypothetical protein
MIYKIKAISEKTGEIRELAFDNPTDVAIAVYLLNKTGETSSEMFGMIDKVYSKAESVDLMILVDVVVNNWQAIQDGKLEWPDILDIYTEVAGG